MKQDSSHGFGAKRCEEFWTFVRTVFQGSVLANSFPTLSSSKGRTFVGDWGGGGINTDACAVGVTHLNPHDRRIAR